MGLLPLNNHGVCASIPVGRTNMDKQELVENIQETVKTIEERFVKYFHFKV